MGTEPQRLPVTELLWNPLWKSIETVDEASRRRNTYNRVTAGVIRLACTLPRSSYTCSCLPPRSTSSRPLHSPHRACISPPSYLLRVDVSTPSTLAGPHLVVPDHRTFPALVAGHVARGSVQFLPGRRRPVCASYAHPGTSKTPRALILYCASKYSAYSAMYFG